MQQSIVEIFFIRKQKSYWKVGTRYKQKKLHSLKNIKQHLYQPYYLTPGEPEYAFQAVV